MNPSYVREPSLERTLTRSAAQVKLRAVRRAHCGSATARWQPKRRAFVRGHCMERDYLGVQQADDSSRVAADLERSTVTGAQGKPLSRIECHGLDPGIGAPWITSVRNRFMRQRRCRPRYPPPAGRKRSCSLRSRFPEVAEMGIIDQDGSLGVICYAADNSRRMASRSRNQSG